MILGIDIGGTNVKLGVVDEAFRVVKKVSVETQKDKGDIEMVAGIISAAKAVFSEFPFAAIGIGSPGCIDSEKGICVSSGNLPYNNTPIVKMFEDAFKMPVWVENDATCAVLGELYAGAGRKYDDFIMITLGTGIGGGIVLNRKLYRGATNLAGELGHMTIKYDGPRCVCGNTGCFEMYASVTALIKQTKQAASQYPDSLLANLSSEQITGKTVFDAAGMGCPVGKMVVDQYIAYLSYGINNVLRNFDPQAVVLGGAISNQGENLLLPLKEKLIGSNHTKIEVSQLGNDAGIIGAACKNLAAVRI